MADGSLFTLPGINDLFVITTHLLGFLVIVIVGELLLYI